MIREINTSIRLWIPALTLMAALIAAGCSKQGQGDSRSEATLADLNKALGPWLMANGKLPQNVSDLTNFPSLKSKRLPTPPPGKKLMIDPATQRVVFGDL